MITIIAVLLAACATNAQTRSVQSFQKISSIAGNFNGQLDNSDLFGFSVANIGDVNSDGINDMAVGAIYDDDGGVNRGAIYILFMKADKTVNTFQKISSTQGGFTGILQNSVIFGTSVSGIGDLDMDGIPDIAVGSEYDNEGGWWSGAVWILFLNADGTVKTHQKINAVQGYSGAKSGNNPYTDHNQIILQSLGDTTYIPGDTINIYGGGGKSNPAGSGNGIPIVADCVFGSDVTCLGDLDGDGIQDLAAGARRDYDGGYQAGAVWILLMNRDGTVKYYQKISPYFGNFGGVLHDMDFFGAGLGSIGDIDGDYIPDLAVGSYQDDDGGYDKGAIYILFMNADGTVKNTQKISSIFGNFTGSLYSQELFGVSVKSAGDIDNDGTEDIIAGAVGDQDGGAGRGAAWILYLNADGTVKSNEKISSTQGGFTGTWHNGDYCGLGVTNLGDINSDSNKEIIITAYADDDGGADRGAAWIMSYGFPQPGSVCTSATQISVALYSASDTILQISGTEYWLKFTADTNIIKIAINKTTDSVNADIKKIYLYTGACNDLQLLSMKDKSIGENLIIVNTTLIPGMEYLVKIEKSQGGTAWFGLNMGDAGWYTGEYQIELDDFQPAKTYIESFEFEVVSFPFAPEEYLSNSAITGPIVRKLTVPNYIATPCTTIDVNNQSNEWATGYAWNISNARKLYQKCYVKPGFNQSTATPPTTLATQFFHHEPASDASRIVLPHSILKVKIKTLTEVITFIADNTRGQMNYYPFGSTDAYWDIKIRPSVRPLAGDGVNHLYNAVSNQSWYDLTSNGTINVFPDNEADPYSYPEDLSSVFPSGDYFYPAPYTIPQLKICNSSGQHPAGYNNSGVLFIQNDFDRSYHKYIINNPIYINELNPAEKIIYNPSSAIIATNLTFPSGYTFKTLEIPGRLPDRALVESNTPAIDGLGLDPRLVNVPITKTTNDPEYIEAYGSMDSIPTYYIGNGDDITGKTLTIDPCVTIMDARFVVYPNCTLKYNPAFTYGNFEIVKIDQNLSRVELTTAGNASYPCSDFCYASAHYDLNNNVDITTSQVWDADYINTTYNKTNADINVNGIIKITTGNTLTILQGVTLRLSMISRIEIEPGAHLILNGTPNKEVVLTNMCFREWDGIVVNGNSYERQLSSVQGKVTANFAKIENALFGIQSKDGGIVIANNSKFKNNRYGIYFTPYPSPGTTFSLPNNTPSVIKDNFFEISSDLNNIDIPGSSFIFVEDYKPLLRIIGNNFENNYGSFGYYAGAAQGLGTGITAFNSNIEVIPSCNSPFSPCPDSYLNRPKFKNLWYGIHSTSTNVITTHIDKCDFENNFRGVLVEGLNNKTTVTNNTFDISYSGPDAIQDPYIFDPLPSEYLTTNYGLYINGSTGYRIENNNFSNGDAGLFINSSGTNSNFVYRNTFNNIQNTTNSVASSALGDNGNANYGLQFICNTYQANAYDIAVTQMGSLNSSIRQMQGFVDYTTPLNPMQSTRNRIDHNNSNCTGTGERAFFVNSTPSFSTYTYKFNQIQDNVTDFENCHSTNINSEPIDVQFNYTQHCPFYMDGISPSTGSGTLSELDAIQYNIASARANLGSLVDNGNTQLLLDRVKNLSPNTYNKVCDALEKSAPFLSDTVLLTFMRNQLQRPAQKYKVLVAASPLPDKAKSEIQSLNVPWPFIQKLQQIQDGTNLRVAKELEIANMEANRSYLLNTVTNLYLANDSVAGSRDSLITLLENETSISPKMLLTSIYTQDAKYAIANQKLSEIDNLAIDLPLAEKVKIDNYITMQTLNIALAQLSKSEQVQLVSDYSVFLNEQANSDNTLTRVDARLLLANTGIKKFSEEIVLPGNNTAKSLNNSNFNNTDIKNNHIIENKDDYYFEIFPNPANSKLTVEFSSGEWGKNSFIEIFSIDGRSVLSIQITRLNESNEIDISTLKEGSYFISLSKQGEKRFNKFFTIIK